MSGELSRREVIQRVTALLGGAALAGGDGLLAFSFDAGARAQVATQGTRVFNTTDVRLLDEIAETILPETSTPGAKAAKTGAFMALMVTDVYSDRNREIFMTGLRQLDETCRAAHGVPFMRAAPAQRLELLETLDREQRAVSEARAAAPDSDLPPHYFRLMKELALQGYFTSEIGYTRAMRYIEAPGKFDPCVPHNPGDRIWASHA